MFLEPYKGGPGIERGTSYVVVAGDDAGRRWTEETRARTGLEENVFAESIVRVAFAPWPPGAMK